MNDEAWLLDVVKRCGVHEARASALARAGAQMLRRLAIKCPPGVFGKGECCRRAVALELAAREAGGANLRREALLTACSSRPAAYDRVLRHAESALGARTMSSGGSAAVVDTIEQLARAVVADEASAAAVADAARGLQTMLRRGAHPDGAQRAACVAAAGQILDLDAQRLCAAAGCSSNDFATACRDLETARRRQRDESQLAFFDAPQGVAARGAGTRGARAREAVLAQQPARPRSPSPEPVPEEPEGDLCYEDFALQLLREECGRRSVPCPATLVPAEAVDEVYAADLETEEIRRVREAFPTADQWAPPAEDELIDGDSSDGDAPAAARDFVCQKGCGRAFATARGRGVHERTCAVRRRVPRGAFNPRYSLLPPLARIVRRPRRAPRTAKATNKTTTTRKPRHRRPKTRRRRPHRKRTGARRSSPTRICSGRRGRCPARGPGGSRTARRRTMRWMRRARRTRRGSGGRRSARRAARPRASPASSCPARVEIGTSSRFRN